MRTRTAGSLALTATLVLGAAAAHAQTDPGAPGVTGPGPLLIVSDDGALTINVPPGAAPPGTPFEALFRAPADIPPELAGIETRSGFYQLLPSDQHFDVPVRVTRTFELDDLGFDPAENGVPLIPLATRSADGEWDWLEDQLQAFDLETGAMTVSGTTAHLGALAGFGGTAFLDPTLAPATPRSARGRLSATLDQPDGLGAQLGTPMGEAWDPRVAQPRAGAVEGEVARVAFDCLLPTSAPISVTVPVDGIGGGLPLLDDLGLGPASLDVVFGGTVDCPLANPMGAGAWPRAIGGRASFDSVLPNGVDYKETVRFLLDRGSGRYERMRMRANQDVQVVHIGEDDVVWFLGGNEAYDEFYALRPGPRPGIIEGVSGGGSPRLFGKVGQVRRGLQHGVEGNRVIDRAFEGKRISDGIIRQAGGRPRELDFLHTVRIRLDTDSEHPADVILGVAQPPKAELPAVPTAVLTSHDPVIGQWATVSLPDGYVRPTFEFGDPGAIPLVGDFDGDGTPGPATFHPGSGRFVARDSFSPGPPDLSVVLDGVADAAFVGDFDGDRIDELLLWDGPTGDLRAFDLPRSGTPSVDAGLDAIFDDLDLEADDELIVGDFDQDGSDDIGFERDGSFFFDGTLDSPSVDGAFKALLESLGDDFDSSLHFGDWDGDHLQTPAAIDPDTGLLRIVRDLDGTMALADRFIFADGFESGDTSSWSAAVP